jgi:penicillin-binding protein 2
VVGLNISDGKSGPWKYRDHGHFISFAPFDNPRYACAVVIEHGGGSSAAYPIARDVMTFLFDPAKAMQVLLEMEKGWGGTPQQRMAARYGAYEARYGTSAPKPDDDNPVASADARAAAASTKPLPEQTEAAAPRPEDAGTQPQPADNGPNVTSPSAQGIPR